MIREYTADIAKQMKIKLSDISIVAGEAVGCLDVHLLKLSSGEFVSCVLVHKLDMDDLQRGLSCERLEIKIRTALERLQLMLTPEQTQQ